MDAHGREVGLLVHVETTPPHPRSRLFPYFDETVTTTCSPTASVRSRLGAALLDILFTILLCTPILVFGAGASLAASLGLDSMMDGEQTETFALLGSRPA